jgi:hypothetical protein
MFIKKLKNKQLDKFNKIPIKHTKMDINIYNKSKVIVFPHSISITYADINKICIILNLPETVGNVIDLPITENWKIFMSTNSSYNINDDIRFHNLRRIIFYVPYYDINNITSFSTDYLINKNSVLTDEDVSSIFDAVYEITYEKKRDQLLSILVDPITHEQLVDPIIASDGITYSKTTLARLFENLENPISPITHERLFNINNNFGIRNRVIIDIVHGITSNVKKEQLHYTLIDPVTLELLIDPIIASDGITYSKATLERLFKDSEYPVSPITRERLILINDTFGVKNLVISDVIELYKM